MLRRIGDTPMERELIENETIPVDNGEEAKEKAFCDRLAQLADQHTIRGLARRIDIPNQNLGRYIKKGLPAASVCRRLVERLGVNPAWLLTGEGSSMLSDVPAVASNTASGLLELVEAMNAVTRMRLGALAGKDHLKVLRELNDALGRYEGLRDKLNTYSEPIFQQIIEALTNALDRERNPDKAEPIIRAGEQVARLCEHPGLKSDFNRQRAHYEHLCGNAEKSTSLIREIVLEGFLRAADLDERGCNDADRLVVALRMQFRIREAGRVAEAALIFANARGRKWPPYVYLLEAAASNDIDLGKLRRALGRFRHVQSFIGEEWRRQSTAPLYALAQFLAGMMTWEQVRDYCGTLHMPNQISPMAMWTEDTGHLADAAKMLDGYDGPHIPRLSVSKIYIDALLAAKEGRDSLADFDHRLANVAGREALIEINTYIVPVIRSQLALLLGDHSAALASCLEVHERLAAAPHVSLPIIHAAIHHRNALRLSANMDRFDATSRTTLEDARKRALKFFRRHIKAGYAVFRPVLEETRAPA
ncbi:MAG: hypothetical protein HUU29_09605 [Planctomycetaceae bacterium]|nr:hypothetical protein [Planctomycetaceae bacterium]